MTMQVQCSTIDTAGNGRFTVLNTVSRKVYNFSTTKHCNGAVIGCFSSTITGIVVSCINPDNVLLEGNGEFKAGVPAWEMTPELKEALYTYISQGALTSTFVLLGDAINKGTERRIPPEMACPYGTPWRVAQFIEYIIETKKGIVYASPIGVNRNHNRPSDLSLCQAFIWVPPESLELVIPGSSAVFNEDNEVTLEKWVAYQNSKFEQFSRFYPSDQKFQDNSWENIRKTGMRKSPLFTRACRQELKKV